ncbi:MAG TPA: hypothetical protein VFQ45_05260 [Longimicrobium sp.]|nr:hypothetical protein [Longimicrobium sp.]
MRFDEFERRAEEMFDSIPPEMRAGIEYVAVERRAVPHPELDEVYTLGECATGELDLGYEVPDAVRSGVLLYHGSFRKLAELDPDFDWEGELWETLTHEIRHHREAGAGEDALEDFDYAADENFKRRDGLPFDPLFYRAGEEIGPDAWDVDGDHFHETTVPPRSLDTEEEIEVGVGGDRLVVPIPEEPGDVSFLYLEGCRDAPGDTAVVLVRRRGVLAPLRDLLRGWTPIAHEYTVEEGDWYRVGEEPEQAEDGDTG